VPQLTYQLTLRSLSWPVLAANYILEKSSSVLVRE